jgi:hypothetical protein
LLIIPWTIRNYVVFHKIAPIRSNGLTEVYFANCGFGTHPLGPSMEYQTLGESEFTAREAVGPLTISGLIPRLSLGDSLRRAMWFWIYPIEIFWPLSLAVDIGALGALIIVFRRSSRTALPLMAVLVVYPLIYYASQVVSRYRHPIDPVLYALSGVALSQVVQRRVTNRAKSAGLPTM